MNDSKLIDLMSNKEIWSSEYLYGVKGSYFKDMPYEEVLKTKIKLGKELKNKIVNELYPDVKTKIPYETSIKLDERLKNINKAIVHNELLLKDMEV